MVVPLRAAALLLAALSVAGPLAGCRSSATETESGDWASIQTTKWILQELGGEPAIDGVEVTLRLEAGNRIYGFGGVNQFFGSYEHDDERFRSHRLAATRMAGPADAMGQEQRLLELLGKANRVELDGERLRFLEADAVLIAFRAER